MAQEKIARKEQREIAREKARAAREAEKRKTKRNKLILQGSVVGGILGVAAIVFLVIANQPEPTSQVNPKNMVSNSVVLTQNAEVIETPAVPKGGTPTPTALSDDKVLISIYVDYLCPYCKLFEEAENDTLRKFLDTGKVNVEYSAIGSLSEYSVVASNASACVASLEPKAWWDVNNALFKAQPEEGTGQTFSKKQSVNHILKTALNNVNLSGETKECIQDNRYFDWAVAATDNILNANPLPNTNVRLEGTPTIIIDGVKFNVQEGKTLDQAISEAIVAKGLL